MVCTDTFILWQAIKQDNLFAKPLLIQIIFNCTNILPHLTLLHLAPLSFLFFTPCVSNKCCNLAFFILLPFFKKKMEEEGVLNKEWKVKSKNQFLAKYLFSFILGGRESRRDKKRKEEEEKQNVV